MSVYSLDSEDRKSVDDIFANIDQLHVVSELKKKLGEFTDAACDEMSHYLQDEYVLRLEEIVRTKAKKIVEALLRGEDYWLTPPMLYDTLNAEFSFNFDPCPYPLPQGFDGLTTEWGQCSYVNPPFGSIIHQGKKKGPTAWARKAIEENKKGKTVVMVYPIDKWVLMLLAAGAKVRNLGDVRWLATEDGSEGKGTGRHIACFILEGETL